MPSKKKKLKEREPMHFFGCIKISNPPEDCLCGLVPLQWSFAISGIIDCSAGLFYIILLKFSVKV
jgi:hypothetical protein